MSKQFSGLRKHAHKEENFCFLLESYFLVKKELWGLSEIIIIQILNLSFLFRLPISTHSSLSSISAYSIKNQVSENKWQAGKLGRVIQLNYIHTLCPWCFPYSLQTQHISGLVWQPSSKQTNSMACTWCWEHMVFSWGLSASGTRLCFANVFVEWVTWEHSEHKWVAHTVQYTDATWASSSSQRMMLW